MFAILSFNTNPCLLYLFATLPGLEKVSILYNKINKYVFWCNGKVEFN